MNDSILNLITSLKMNRVLEQEYMRVTCNLSIAEYRGIMSQEKGQETTCMELSEIMGLSPSRSSRVIDNLVRRGYLIRKTSTRDRRSMAITLSEKGIEAKEKIKKNQKELEDDLKKRFSDEVINSIKSSLKILLEYFE
jgi:DNA-binding MarR family transcriptional regulator